MIVDVRTYTMHPGKLPAMIAHYGEKGWPIQNQYLGNCRGWFVAEVGTLNRVVHIWQYEDIADREARRARMQADAGWQSFLREGAGRAAMQDNKIMKPAPFFPFENAKAGPIGVLDVRTYTLKHGATADYLKLYQAEALPLQQKHLGHCLGWYVSDIGPLNQVFHVWAYPSFDERMRRRAEQGREPGFAAYLGKMGEYVQHMENSIMVPAPFWTPKP